MKKSLESFEEWAIRLTQGSKRAAEKRRRISLTSKGISELLTEGIITITLLPLSNVSILVVISSVINSSPSLTSAIWDSKNIFAKRLNTDLSWNDRNLITLFFFLLDIGVLYWRLVRRYRQVQLRHIISELRYITNGNYDHRISFELSGDLSQVVASINRLADSTVAAIKDEREIEKSKNELITNVSRNIRTPLTSVVGYLGLIEDGQYHSGGDLLKYTRTAYVKAKQMKPLMDDLFEYTKVRQPAVPVNFSALNMIWLIEQLAADFELEASKKNIQILVQLKVGSLIMGGDTEKLVRVFSNLLANALKYEKGAAKAIIEVERVGSEVVATVKNNRAIIPQQTIDNLFDRSYRAEKSHSQATGGTGLSLTIAQSIVALHGGCIYAKSDKQRTSSTVHLLIEGNEKLPIDAQEIINES